jgi:hypothetical protein
MKVARNLAKVPDHFDCRSHGSPSKSGFPLGTDYNPRGMRLSTSCTNVQQAMASNSVKRPRPSGFSGQHSLRLGCIGECHTDRLPRARGRRAQRDQVEPVDADVRVATVFRSALDSLGPMEIPNGGCGTGNVSGRIGLPVSKPRQRPE